MTIPKQVFWVVRKIIEVRNMVDHSRLVCKTIKNMIRQAHLLLIGQQLRHPGSTSWKCLVFKNEASAKAKFTIWLHFQDKMLTSDRLSPWRIIIDTTGVLCSNNLRVGITYMHNVHLLNDYGTDYCLGCKNTFIELLHRHIFFNRPYAMPRKGHKLLCVQNNVC